MEESRQDQTAVETKGSEKDSKPDSAAAMGTGADQKGAKQDAAEAAAEAFSKPPGGDSGNEAAHKSNGEPGGTSLDQSEAAGGRESVLDAKTQKLVDARIDARVKSLLESELEPLLEVNRKLAVLLGEQIEITIKLRHSVVAMERLMEADARRKGKYAAMLEKVTSEGDGRSDPHWINRTRGMLGQLQRTGTTGPKVESETGQR